MSCPICLDPVPTPPGYRAGGDGSHRSCLATGMRNNLFTSVAEWEMVCKWNAPAAAAAPEDEFEGQWRKMNHTCAELPAGTYYIGDPCYAEPAFKEYRTVWGDLFGHSNGYYTNGSETFVVCQTAYGDGEYEGSDGKNYGVDSGTIAILSKGLFDLAAMKKSYKTPPGSVYAFTQPVTVRMGGGRFSFDSGWFSLEIDTSD